MFFDQFAGIAEHHLPPLMETVRNAKLFQFPGRANVVLPKVLDWFPSKTRPVRYFAKRDSILPEMWNRARVTYKKTL